MLSLVWCEVGLNALFFNYFKKNLLEVIGCWQWVVVSFSWKEKIVGKGKAPNLF